MHLCQIIAIESNTKNRVQTELTEAHKVLQRNELFNGHARRYTPKDDDPNSPVGEKLPDENKKVQFNAEALIKQTAEKLTELFDVNATREWGNCKASADIVVDGQTLLKDVPVSYLLFLEKKLVDIHTFVQKLPTLDPGEKWERDVAQDLWSTQPVGGARTKKITRPFVLYEATKEHPAQVKEVVEDVFAGTWNTTKYSSALPVSRVNEMLRRIVELQKAVKFAREQANSIEVTGQVVGQAVLGYLFQLSSV